MIDNSTAHAVANDLDRAAALLAAGQVGQAEALVRAGMGQGAPSPAARVLLGRISQSQGRIEEAQAEFRAVVQADPTCAEAWRAWACLLETHGHAPRAEECLRLALTYLPALPEIHTDLSAVLLSLGKLDAAETAAREALRLAPETAVAWCSLGLVRGRRGDVAAAVEAFRKAVALDSLLPEAHNGLGAALQAIDPPAATEALRAALRLRPAYAEALDNLGVLAVFQGRLSEAIAHFDEALSADPRFLRAVGHKTNALFLAGRLTEAWKIYRRRFEVEKLKHDPHGRFPQPVWQGESLHHKPVLVWTELGLGEEILQAGMLKDLARITGPVSVECSPRLGTLFKRSFPGMTIIPRTNPARACPVAVAADVQIAGGDLGGLLRDQAAKFVPHQGYLVADSVHVSALRKKYAQPGKIVVGLSWASTRSGLGKGKTLALADVLPVLKVPGVVFVNLQYDVGSADIAMLQSNNVLTDPEIDFAGDMDSIAAQTAAMDLVISVSNTTVHMAGALNIPVWNIVPAHNATGLWHWFFDVEESPWYPAMKIYRRRDPTPQKLMQTVMEDLRARVRGA